MRRWHDHPREANAKTAYGVQDRLHHSLETAAVETSLLRGTADLFMLDLDWSHPTSSTTVALEVDPGTIQDLRCDWREEVPVNEDMKTPTDTGTGKTDPATVSSCGSALRRERSVNGVLVPSANA